MGWMVPILKHCQPTFLPGNHKLGMVITLYRDHTAGMRMSLLHVNLYTFCTDPHLLFVFFM
jgi:hypothetical protein